MTLWAKVNFIVTFFTLKLAGNLITMDIVDIASMYLKRFWLIAIRTLSYESPLREELKKIKKHEVKIKENNSETFRHHFLLSRKS